MRIRSFVVYSLLRLLAFFVPFGIMMLFPVMRTQWWLAAIFAALIGLSLSTIFLRRPMENLTADMLARKQRRDAAQGSTAQGSTAQRRSAAEEDAAIEDAANEQASTE